MNFLLQALVALVGLSTAVASDTGSPVERIVKLLSSLKEKTVNDGKHEQDVYDKYACWCETTSSRKANDIVEAQNELRALGQRILKLKGKTATRAAEIKELTESIEANENEQEALTSVREKQNAAWQATSAEVKQALSALQEAISVLAAATTPQKGSALLQENQMLQAKYAVSAVLNELPSMVGLPPARMALLTEFTSAKAGFAPQSATIQGMLGDMYLTFANNLESDTLAEANQNGDYEEMTASLEKQNNKNKAIRGRKETEKAEAESMLADTTKAYEDTEKQMGADTDFFDQTNKACRSKHAEWEVRKEMRSAELDGINKALEILTGDGARALFADAIKPGVGFLQIASQDSNGAPEARAYNAVKSLSKKSHSFRLAALAVHIRTTKAGHFDKVMGEIDKMLKTLQEEGDADLEKKNQCLDEYQNIAQTVKKLDWQVKNNNAKIEKLAKLIELREEQKADTVAKIKDTKKYIQDITDERKNENDAFKQAVEDDNGALVLLKKAKAALAKFYEAEVALVQGGPAFERSEDAAPDATLSGKGNNAGKTKGILALFDYIIEDVTDELSNEKKAEANSQAEFDDELETAETLLADLKDKKVNLKNLIAKRGDDKNDENTDKKGNNKDRDDELAYQAKIKPDCDWIMRSFDQRATARAAEADGLTTAKEFLAGKTALLQTSKFDDEKLPSLGFLHLH